MDKIEELYEKILDNQDWDMDDLDKLIELVKAEGYEYGQLSAKQAGEHISTVQDCELAVRVTKEKAIGTLSSILENWVRGGDADCIIAEFEEKLNINVA